MVDSVRTALSAAVVVAGAPPSVVRAGLPVDLVLGLFQAQANLRFGRVILRHYLNVEEGNLHMALGRYNGSRGQMQYPNAVLAAQRQSQ